MALVKNIFYKFNPVKSLAYSREQSLEKDLILFCDRSSYAVCYQHNIKIIRGVGRNFLRGARDIYLWRSANDERSAQNCAR